MLRSTVLAVASLALLASSSAASPVGNVCAACNAFEYNSRFD